MKVTGHLADFDSATAMLRALSRFLDGRDFPMLGTQPVSITAEYLPPHVSCRPAELHAAETEYRLSCEAEASAKPGEYEFQLTPASVVVGLDKRELPYKIAPVTAKLIISETKTTQAAR